MNIDANMWISLVMILIIGAIFVGVGYFIWKLFDKLK